VQILHHGKEVIKEWWPTHNLTAQSGASGKGSEAGIPSPIYWEPKEEVWKEAWRVTEAVLLQMRDEIVQLGAQMFLVVLTNGSQVNPDISRQTEFAQWLGVNDLFYPDRRVKSFCQSHGIPVLLLGPYLQHYAVQHKVFFHGFGDNLGSGHWNQNGHRLAGQIIAKWLCPQLN
jgi:hypothetical protein